MSASAARIRICIAVEEHLPAVIRSAAENERHLAMREDLDHKGNRMSAAEPRMAVAHMLVEDFGAKHYAADRGPGRMVANPLQQKDLVDTFRTPGIASEVLGGKRKRNAEPIRRRSRRFKVSPEVFFECG